MPSPARILEQLRAGPPPEMSSADVVKLLEYLGWEVRDGKGSHLIVTTPKGNKLTLARNARKIKRVYLRMLLNEM